MPLVATLSVLVGVLAVAAVAAWTWHVLRRRRHRLTYVGSGLYRNAHVFPQ